MVLEDGMECSNHNERKRSDRVVCVRVYEGFLLEERFGLAKVLNVDFDYE